ncbi:MAG: glycosyltransferase [Campylobacterota bacterium]
MKVSLIIPTYKDTIALKLILDALQYQTYKNFEVIVAEDDNSRDTLEILSNYKAPFDIKHYYHEDKGNRKPKAVNASIAMSSGTYIILIDGDTIPFSTFIEYHVLLSEPQKALCGRRVNIGDKVSSDLRNNRITAKKIEDNYIKMYKYLKNDNIRHYEQGISFHPHSFLYKLFAKANRNIHIVASNFSCFKEDLLKVNGIDEDLPYAPSRDDTDLEWRLKAVGIEMKSAKYCANLLHLNHSRTDRKDEDEQNRILIANKQIQNQYKAKNGIIKC